MNDIADVNAGRLGISPSFLVAANLVTEWGISRQKLRQEHKSTSSASAEAGRRIAGRDMWWAM